MDRRVKRVSGEARGRASLLALSVAWSDRADTCPFVARIGDRRALGARPVRIARTCVPPAAASGRLSRLKRS